MKHQLLKYSALFALLLILSSCVEEVNFENEAFEYVLIIDATLTDEDKHHRIFINRAHRFEEDGPNRVTGATVQVITDAETYSFEEEAPGTYTSVVSFKANPNTNYQLLVTTQNGKVYTSTAMQLTTATQIDNLYALRDTNDDGINGVSIYLDSYDPSNTSKFYRYEFEETFKVVAPLWKNQDMYIVADDYPNCIVGLTPRSEDKITCYKTDPSNYINLNSTSALAEDRVSKHLVRFLSSESYQISHRYSILVTQYVQTEQAYDYFKTLGSFNEEGSLFSQIQTGYIFGNLTSEDASEKIVGFFEVASVDKKRIYFDYTDFYDGEPLPPYAVPCTLDSPALNDISHNYMCGPIMNIIRNNSQVYLRENTGEFPRGGGPYITVPRACGDCTALGETRPPEFWIE